MQPFVLAQPLYLYCWLAPAPEGIFHRVQPHAFSHKSVLVGVRYRALSSQESSQKIFGATAFIVARFRKILRRILCATALVVLRFC